MRREYDFSEGIRGKHAGKRVRIIGDTSAAKGKDTAARIQHLIELDLKSREDFKTVWRELKPAARKSLRADWLEKINAVLANQ